MNKDVSCPSSTEELCELVISSIASKSSLLVKGSGSMEGWGQLAADGQSVVANEFPLQPEARAAGQQYIVRIARVQRAR